MRKVLALVEGQTEEQFIKLALRPRLRQRGIEMVPVIVASKRPVEGGKYRGGIASFRKVESDLRRLLGDTSAVAVTTMIDYYGLPSDFPGVSAIAVRRDPAARASRIEDALSAHFRDPRLRPYLSLHEFEALLLTRPEEIERAVGAPGLGTRLGEAVRHAGGPERVNDSPETHPSRRIRDAAPTYGKLAHGPIVAERIGLEAMRGACPHFAGWLGWLESLATS